MSFGGVCGYVCTNIGFGLCRCFACQPDLCGFVCDLNVLGIDAAFRDAALLG
nr:hypothetical protein [Neisseria lactamica]